MDTGKLSDQSSAGVVENRVLLIVIGVLYGLAFVTGLRRRPVPVPR